MKYLQAALNNSLKNRPKNINKYTKPINTSSQNYTRTSKSIMSEQSKFISINLSQMSVNFEKKLQKMIEDKSFSIRIFTNSRGSILKRKETIRDFDKLGKQLELTTKQKELIFGKIEKAYLGFHKRNIPLRNIWLVFTYEEVDVAKIMLSLNVMPSVLIQSRQIAKFLTENDWLKAIGIVPVDSKPTSFTVTAPVSTVAEYHIRDKRKRKTYKRHIITPNATWTDDILHALHVALNNGNDVSCIVKSSNNKQIKASFKLDEIHINDAGKRTGLYLGLNRMFNAKKFKGKIDIKSATLRNNVVNAELFWSQDITHVLSPVPDKNISRYAFSLNEKEQRKIYAEISQGKETAQLPLIETKSHRYRFFLDIDLDHTLFKKMGVFSEIKALQSKFFIGEKHLGFKNLLAQINELYPGTTKDANVYISQRENQETNSLIQKEGYHLIFSKLIIPNDGRTGWIITSQLEATAAYSFLKSHSHPLVVFLLNVLINDSRREKERSNPIQYAVNSDSIQTQTIVKTFSDMLEVAKNSIIFFLRESEQGLTFDHNAQLLDAAFVSMGEHSLQKHLQHFKNGIGEKGRLRASNRLAKRCRWEILRRTRFFDHSVYGKTIGLRLLGTSKNKQDTSRYIPLHHKGSLTEKNIEKYSIRESKRKLAIPTDKFIYVLAKYGVAPNTKSFTPLSLDGFLMQGRLRRESQLADLEYTFRITKKRKTPITRSLTVQLDKKDKENINKTKILPIKTFQSETKNRKSQQDDEVYEKEILLPNFQLLDNRGKDLHVIRQKRAGQSTWYQQSRQERSEDEVEIKVRVYIPAPAVTGGYNGNDRDESYNEGTSKLDVEIDLDLETGNLNSQAAWGSTAEYDGDDIIDDIPGKPHWWKGIRPGAEPIDTDQIEVDDDNLKITKSINSDGGTEVDVEYSGANPLVSFAPPINGKFSVTFNPDGSVDIEGEHDGFPAHTLYINGNNVYKYDPEDSNRTLGPLSLFGDSDIKVKKKHLEKIPDWPRSQSGGDGQSRRDGGADPGDGDYWDNVTPSDGNYDFDDDFHGGGGTSSGTGGDNTAGSGNTEDPDASNGTFLGGERDTENNPYQNSIYWVEATQNTDGSITASDSGGGEETFDYNSETGVWVGDHGSLIHGEEDLFNTDNLMILEVWDENGNKTTKFCSGGTCVEVLVHDSYAH